MNQNRNAEIAYTQGLVSRRVWPAWVILAAAIILTTLVTLYMKTDVDVQAKREFQFACNEIRGKIDDRLAAHEQILLSGAALFDAFDQITREEWRTFTQRLNVESNFPGIQGIGFALRIPPDRLAQHVQEMRSEGFPDYNVRPEGDRDAYSAIIYLEPFLGRNLRAFGYDMLSEPMRRGAMERARDQNEAALSGKVVLVQETEKDIQAGTLMYVPVYRRGMPTETVEQRREALFGWVYSPYRMTDLMSGILGGWDSLGGLRIRLQVYDGTRLSPDTILYDSHAAKDMGPAPQFTEEVRVNFNGSLWILRFIQAGRQVSLAKVWVTLASGMIISLLLFGITLSLINSRFNAGQMAVRLTTELRESEGFLRQSEKIGGIGGWKANLFTDTLHWTQGVYDILGAPKDYSPGLDAGLEFYTPAYRPIIKEAIAKTLEHGEPFKIEAEVITTGGKHLWTEVRGSKRVEEGEGPEIIGSFQDITERKLAEEALRETQENFRSFFETMDDIIIVGEPDGKIIYSNLALSRKLGYTPEELTAMHVLDLHPVEKRQEAERIFAEMFRGERDACPLPLAKKDGVYLPVETRIWFGKWSGKDCIFGLSKDLSMEQEALQKFNRLFNGNPAPMAVSSLPERKFTEVNEAFLTTMGFSRDEVVGKTSVELGLFPEPEIQSRVALSLQDEGSVRNVEMKVRKKDGTIADGLFFGEIIDNQGHKNLLSVMVDITERKRAERELAQKQALLQGLLESIPDIVFFKDINGVYLGCNSEFAIFVGRDEKEIIGHTDYALFGKDVADLFRENDGLMMEQGVARHNEEWIDYPDGRRVLIDTIKAPLRSINGDTIGVLGVSRDITESKRIEEALRESEGRFRGMFESHSAVMLLVEPETGEIMDANSAAERFYGYTMFQLRSMSIQEINILPPNAVEMERILALQECRNFFVFPHRLASGEVRTVEVHSSPIEHNGKVMLFSIIHDISERKRLEREVKQAAEEFRTVADFTYDWEYWIAPDGSLVYVSPSCERITGYNADEFINNPGLIQEIAHYEDQPIVADHLPSINSGPPHQSEFRIVSRAGETHWIGHICQAVYSADGRWLGRRVSNRDITKLKEAE